MHVFLTQWNVLAQEFKHSHGAALGPKRSCKGLDNLILNVLTQEFKQRRTWCHTRSKEVLQNHLTIELSMLAQEFKPRLTWCRSRSKEVPQRHLIIELRYRNQKALVRACMYVRIYVRIHVFMYPCMYLCIYVSMHVCMCASMSLCTRHLPATAAHPPAPPATRPLVKSRSRLK